MTQEDIQRVKIARAQLVFCLHVWGRASKALIKIATTPLPGE